MCRTSISCLALACLILLSCYAAKEVTDLEMLGSAAKYRCSYERVFDMYGAHCAGLKLEKIPSLKSGIEVLDFSDNKLRKLHADTLSSYSSIKFLYLAENHIYMINEDAFSYLTSLQTLDISKNAITVLPTTIFQLASLRKLYLNGNPLIHLHESAATMSKPIKAPLELLDLSDCELPKLPDLGILPYLNFYNVSRNPLISLEARSFAQACNLRKVDLTGSIDRVKLCDIRPAVTWFEDSRISFVLEDYSRLNSREFETCPRDELTPQLNATQRQCKSVILLVQNVKTSRRTWLTIGGGLAGFMVGFILLLYVMHRRNVAQTKNAVKKQQPTAGNDKNATAILLNNAA